MAMFQAVIASCWPSEYAVAVAASVTSIERRDVGGLVDADPARRHRDGVGDRVAARDRHDGVERDGDPVAGEEHGDHAELGQPRAERGQRHAQRVLARVGEDRSALHRLGPEPFQLAPEDPAEHHHQQHGAGADQQHPHRVVVERGKLQLQRSRHRQEQVHVDERARDAEEDLLDDHAAEHARQIGAGDDRHEHQQAARRCRCWRAGTRSARRRSRRRPGSGGRRRARRGRRRAGSSTSRRPSASSARSAGSSRRAGSRTRSR